MTKCGRKTGWEGMDFWGVYYLSEENEVYESKKL